MSWCRPSTVDRELGELSIHQLNSQLLRVGGLRCRRTTPTGQGGGYDQERDVHGDTLMTIQYPYGQKSTALLECWMLVSVRRARRLKSKILGLRYTATVMLLIPCTKMRDFLLYETRKPNKANKEPRAQQRAQQATHSELGVIT